MATVSDQDDDAIQLPPPAGVGRLGRYGAAWHEAVDIAEAHRVRLRNVLEQVYAGVTAREAARRAGIIRT